MKRTFAALLIAVLFQAAGAAAPSPVKRTKELYRSEAMYIMGGKEHRSKKVLRIDVLIPSDMTESELIAVSDHYRAKYAAKEILHVEFWDDAEAYKRFMSAEDDQDIPVEVTDHLKARYEKDSFRIYGKPVHRLTLLKPKAGGRRTIGY